MLERGMRFLAFAIATIALLVLSSPLYAQKPSYDHQTETYTAQFQPVQVRNSKVSLTPFFSPDYSIETLVKVILEAKESIDISIPGFSSWRSCTYPQPGKTCIGCKASELISSESFPVFQALNNALHKGIKVNILTNDYNDEQCEGKMDLLTYLQLAGAKVHYYKTTTFTHSKYIAIDNKTIVISSINFTKTSIMSNREAGIIIRNGQQNNPISVFTQSVFHYDFEHGYEKELQKYSEEDLALIKNANYIPIVIPTPYHFNYCNASSGEPYEIIDDMDVKIIASPDFAFDEIMSSIISARESLQISIYQITDENFCNALVDMKQARPGLQLKIFVSNDIYGDEDRYSAIKCYNFLYKHGIVVKYSHEKCLRYSHQKFWIIDEEVVYMSTGNLSPTDYPAGSSVFPPYGHKNWVKVNRDYTIKVENSTRILTRFQNLFDHDYKQGYDFNP